MRTWRDRDLLHDLSEGQLFIASGQLLPSTNSPKMPRSFPLFRRGSVFVAFVLFLVVVGIEPGAVCTLSKHSLAALYPQSLLSVFGF